MSRLLSRVVRLGVAGFVLAAVSNPVPAGSVEDWVRRIEPRVEALRGLRFERAVPVTIVGDAEAREYALERFRKFTDEEEVRAQEEAFALLGLLDPGTRLVPSALDLLDEQLGGFYDPNRRSLSLLDDMPQGLIPVLVAHELTHALEDQHFDLDRRLKRAVRDDDRAFAVSAIHEGSATLLMGAYLAEALREGTVTANDLAEVAQSEAGRGAKLQSAPQVLSRPLLGAYVLGASFLLRGDPSRLASGRFPGAEVDRCYREGPVSSEQILHPEKYWDESSRDVPRTIGPFGVDRVLGRGWRRQGDGTLGELMLGILTGAPMPSAMDTMSGKGATSFTNAAAAGWGGDRWELWGSGDARVALLLTVWDSPQDAAEFEQAISSEALRGLARRAGDRVAVVAGRVSGRDEVLLERVLGARVRAPRHR